MRKQLMATALIVGMMAGSLAGCGSKTEGTQPAAPAQSEAAQTEAAKTEAEKAEEGKTEAKTEAPAENVEYGPILSKVNEAGKIVAAISAKSQP